jgi:5-oxoprolinase (ATP-hydrolysing)
MFRKPLTLSVLTDRRVLPPYGLRGGDPGSRGLNLLRRSDGRVVNLGGKCSVDVDTGEVFILRTPGGGGWGRSDEQKK